MAVGCKIVGASDNHLLAISRSIASTIGKTKMMKSAFKQCIQQSEFRGARIFCYHIEKWLDNGRKTMRLIIINTHAFALPLKIED